MRNKIISIVFLIVIMVIPIVTMVECSSSGEIEQVTDAETMNDAVDAFLEEFPYRKEFAYVNTNVTLKITGNTYMESTQVLLGKNNWLYMKETLDDFQGNNCYTEEEKQQFLTQLVKHRDAFESMGIEFAIYVAPNKATIYPENMSDTIIKRNEKTRTEDLIAYIREYSNIKVIYPKEELILAKELSPVYYTTDTHWNEVGGYVGTQVLLKELFGYEDRFTADMIHVKEEYRPGDLAKIGNVRNVIREDIQYTIMEDDLDLSLKSDKTLYFVGDSFYGSMRYYVPLYFEKLYYTHYHDYDFIDMYEYKPDIVVWEIVERNKWDYAHCSLLADDSDSVYDENGKLHILMSPALELVGNDVRYEKDGIYKTDSLEEIDGHLYYFDEQGNMLTECFKTIGEHIYYFGKLGLAKTGWVFWEDEYYYFDDNCHMVKGQWVVNENEEWFYISEDGTMLTDGYTPDGYYVNENGQWVQ